MKLHDLRPTPGSRPSSRRLGRGHGSGRGKTAGRGTKGQKSRAGGKIPAWFEGGQTPIHIRTPKLHGFRNRGRIEYAPLNLARLSDIEAGTLITPDALVHDGLLSDAKLPVKILGNGDAPKGVTIHAHRFSRTAADKLAAAGSTALLISWPDNGPIDEEEVAAAAEATATRNRRRQAKRRKGTAAKAESARAASAAAETEGETQVEAAAATSDEPVTDVESAEATDEGESEPPA